MKAKRRIHKFNFDQEKTVSGKLTHVALVDAAANLTEALIMKSKVTSTTFREEEWSDEDGSYSEKSETIRIHDDGADSIRITSDKQEYSSFYIKVR